MKILCFLLLCVCEDVYPLTSDDDLDQFPPLEVISYQHRLYREHLLRLQSWQHLSYSDITAAWIEAVERDTEVWRRLEQAHKSDSDFGVLWRRRQLSRVVELLGPHDYALRKHPPLLVGFDRKMPRAEEARIGNNRN